MNKIKYILFMMFVSIIYINNVDALSAKECAGMENCVSMCKYQLENGNNKKNVLIYMDFEESTKNYPFFYSVYDSNSSKGGSLEGGSIINTSPMSKSLYKTFEKDGKCPSTICLSKSEYGEYDIFIGDEDKCQKTNFKSSILKNEVYSYTTSSRTKKIKKYVEYIYNCDKMSKDDAQKDMFLINLKNLRYPTYIQNIIKEQFKNIEINEDICEEEIKNDTSLSEEEKKQKLKENEENTDKNVAEMQDSFIVKSIKKDYSGDISGGATTCDELLGEELLDLIKSYYKYILIGVPVLIIILGMFDFGSAALSQKDEDMKKSQSRFIKRLIIGIVIMLIPTVIVTILGIVNMAGETTDSKTYFRYLTGDECVKEIIDG